ncbi:hypothetical protein [Burkholderia gladioli]|uniref:hypothetical protein n=1 Tax=Burkholderia gladioli TaxID=28095 RepID=UPI00163FCF95|nr:hypothetical protein [Burkholderia gladioli]
MTEEGNASAEAKQGDGALTNRDLIARLRVRAADCGQKSMTARLTAVIDLVEALIARGYDRSQVREWLITAGWRFTPDSFDSALGRIRKRRSVAGHSGESRPPGTRDTQASTPGNDVKAATSTPTSADEVPPIGGSKWPSFAEVFAERQNFVAGRRWK